MQIENNKNQIYCYQVVGMKLTVILKYRDQHGVNSNIYYIVDLVFKASTLATEVSKIYMLLIINIIIMIFTYIKHLVA